MAKLLSRLRPLFKSFVDVLLPPVCYVCGGACSGKYGLCYSCLGKMKHILPPYCHKCGRRTLPDRVICNECNGKRFNIEKSWSCCYYESTLKDCIHLFKYSRYLGLMDVFRDIMVDFARKNEIPKNVDLIVPVPMHATKKRERTYNHSEILALSLAKNLAISIDIKNLKKIKWTQSQSELDKHKRMKNVKDTFLVIDKNAFSGRQVLLVDDVYTTGATINECAKAILDRDAAKVFSLTLARGA